MLACRADLDEKGEAEAVEAIKELHGIQMEKLEEIMVRMANEAEDIEERNNELTRNKGEPNRNI